MTSNRRLSAVLAADVVGYSRLMQSDESGTLSALKDFRTGIFEPLVAGHDGSIIKRMGDGWLVEFAAIADALRCALNIQTEAAAAGGPLRLRVGVHMGDVVHDEEDIYGDGVNVAARLQQAADPGSVLVSDIVQRSVEQRLRALLFSDGQRRFKNMPQPIEVFRWVGPTSGSAPAAATIRPAAHHLMIAVLPFDNLSNDPEQEFFADGITEEIITTLSKLPNLQVVARNSTFVYKGRSVDVKQVGRDLGVDLVLEGSIRSGGRRVRITAQLIDVKDGMHVWADRYDRQIEDVFEVQDEIALRIATELHVELLEGEMARFRGSGTRNLDAWAEQLRAVSFTRKMTREACAEARRHAERALALDQDYAAPLGTLGFVNTIEARHGFSASRPKSLSAARSCANRALALEPYNPEAYAVLGFADAIEGNLDTAITLFRTALEQNPNHADVAARLSITLTFNGQATEAIRMAQQAIRLNPQYPGWYAGNLGFALRMAGRYAEAGARFREYSERETGFGLLDLVLVHMATGDEAAARQQAGEFLGYRPEFTITRWVETQLFADQSLLERDRDALLRAGLPA